MPRTSPQTPQPTPFNLARDPLAGINLIDASAGTGKTYTICGLVLRLLLEKNLSIEQILVVTYTEAATEDLRSRIRHKLLQALQAIISGHCDDDFLQEYLQHIDDLSLVKIRLTDALRNFDEAAIYTIHSFCQRMLLENSFESNSLFDTELIADDSYLVKEIIEDFWRRNFYQGSDLFTEYAARHLDPKTLLDFLGPFLPHPFLQFIPAVAFEEGCCDLSVIETRYSKIYRNICTAWATARHEVSHDLLFSKTLNRNKYSKTRVAGMIAAMDAMAAACCPSLLLFDTFALFSASRITAGTKARKVPQILCFYELCDELVQLQYQLTDRYDRCLLAMKKRLLDYFIREFSRRKKGANIFSFDDLLRKLHEALTGPGGSSLARTVAQEYPAALIDEFQDTDPLQFEIFSAIYKEHLLLFLIGDPKQAIYSFRGADIFTYMAAAASPLAHHTLNVNYRSSPELVKAVNTLFSRIHKPFIFDEISFQPVSATQNEEKEWLGIDNRQEAPFILWYMQESVLSGSGESSAGRKTTKTAARRSIIAAVASEVVNLLNLAAESRICINGNSLQPGDIAILVRKNDEARKMQQALTACQVASVLHSGEDLFVSEEAKEMVLLLEAIADSHNINKVKTAMFTRVIGLQAAEIELAMDAAPENERTMEQWLTRFNVYHEIWNRHGFIQMFWAVLAENRTRARLLGLKNGERSLTNILHLAEILHQEDVGQGLNMTALVGYLHDRLAGQQTVKSEHQLRLESDTDRVRIVTVHKAKGLEYPVVFCPFTWEGSRLDPKKGCIFHRPKDSAGKAPLIYDGGSPELGKHLQLARQEELSENLRLLYVAVTRAVHRCYLIWGAIRGTETSAPAYLLHHRSAADNESDRAAPSSSVQVNDIEKAAARFLKLKDHEILADLKELAAASEDTIRIWSPKELPAVSFLQEGKKTAPLHYSKFTGVIPCDWKISSFSSLAAHKTPALDLMPDERATIPGRDEFPAAHDPLEETEGQQKKITILSFPRGAKTGTLLHEVLEQFDFNRTNPGTEQFIHEKLELYNYDAEWYPAIADMLANLGSVALHEDIPDLKLSNIPRENCLRELEFYFPLSRITPDGLNTVFSRNGWGNRTFSSLSSLEQQDSRLTFSPAKGFMKGFIDLVFEFQGRFYLVDWKSNYLGGQGEAYHHGRLTSAMHAGFYFLQYHIYSLALHLYLQNRLVDYQYTSHFGGVFYIFLRGVNRDLGPEYGIFHDLPVSAMMEELTARLLAGNSGR